MPELPETFPGAQVYPVSRWSNYSGTVGPLPVPEVCTLLPGDDDDSLELTGKALKTIIQHCFDSPTLTLRAIGSRWSFSDIIKPGKLIVDPGNLSNIFSIKPERLTPTYRAQRSKYTPLFVQGGTQIGSLNRALLGGNLALQTSGAGDGHRFAGCIATGTHGSAIDVGAVHDGVLGIHLVTAPEQSVFLQPSTPACTEDVTQWLRDKTGLFVETVNDSELFAAAQVALGSLGFVHGVVLETEPLYALSQTILNRPFNDAAVWDTLGDLQTARLHPGRDERPFHFEVVFNPYPIQGRPGAFVKLMWKESARGVPHDSPDPVAPDMSSDSMGLIGELAKALKGNVADLGLRVLIAEQLEKRYKPGDRGPRLPGMVFGPTGLPPGNGASTEVAVAQEHVQRALQILFKILDTQSQRGNHLLGPVAVRFVPASKALLAMNISQMNCFIELPSIRNSEVLGIYRLWWDALANAGVPYTCHWGQLTGMNPDRLAAYFGNRVDRWKAARDRLLAGGPGKRVFSAPLLAEVGLA